MEQDDDDEEDLYYDGAYSSDPPKPKSKEELLKEEANRIYNKLISNDDLMREVNVLLRKHKLNKLKNG